MRINWFSPLPQAKTDIAHYTARIIPELSKISDVTLWTNQREWGTSLKQFAEIRSLEVSDHVKLSGSIIAEINKADITFYNIGNNVDFHGFIWQVSSCCPGVVVLHDIHLQHFFKGLFLDRWNDLEGFRHRMGVYYGQEGCEAVDAFCQQRMSIDELSAAYPLTGLGLENALGAFVHNPSALTMDFVHNVPVCLQPLPYPVRPLIGGSKRGNPPYHLIVFGYIGFNRRVEVILDALACFPLKEMFRLDIYGELWQRDLFERKIEELDLKQLVSLHGFVPESELDAALSRADMALNLRFPTMGEASGSQLRLWDHALPSMVTRVGWYKTLSEEAVVFIDPENEIADIHKHLEAFLDDPDSFIQKGLAGRDLLVNEHSPSSYARAIIDFSEIIMGRRTESLAWPLINKIGSDLRTWLPPSPTEKLATMVSSQIFKMLG